MISVKVVKNNDKIKKISTMGHAMYDDYGKDIVCASVSTLVISTVNNILSLSKDSINVINSDGKVIIDVKENDNITITLLNNMLNNLNILASNYPENIKIINEEE